MKRIIFLIIIFTLYISVCLAQTNNSKNPKIGKTKVIKKSNPALIFEQDEIERKKLKQMDKESSYYVPIRYLIVYDYIIKLSSDERRLEVLMDECQLNEENIIKVLELIKKRFFSPMRLAINIHTSLATIETPEENEMLRDGNDSRFAHTYSKYKEAFYMRFENGRESFSYTISLSPFKEKQVVLKDIK